MKDTGPKDVLVVMLSDLRSLMNGKPGGSSLSELIRFNKSIENSKDKWAPEGIAVSKLFYPHLTSL